MTDLSYVVRHSWWFVFHIIKLQLPWGLIVCTSQFLFPESVSVEIVSFKIKTNCVSCTNLVIFDLNWEKFSTQAHKPLWRRVIWKVFPYLVWTPSLRSLPSCCTHRMLPPSVTLNSNKRRQVKFGYIYCMVLQSRNGAEKKTSRKEQFWFTSSPSIIVVDRHFMVRTIVSSDLNRLVKRICRISRLKATHFSLKRVN